MEDWRQAIGVESKSPVTVMDLIRDISISLLDVPSDGMELMKSSAKQHLPMRSEGKGDILVERVEIREADTGFPAAIPQRPQSPGMAEEGLPRYLGMTTHTKAHLSCCHKAQS